MMEKYKKPESEKLVAGNFRYKKAHIEAIDRLSILNKKLTSEIAREIMEAGLDVVNVRKDGYTVQICLFSDEQNRIIEECAKENDMTVNEVINQIVEERFK